MHKLTTECTFNKVSLIDKASTIYSTYFTNKGARLPIFAYVSSTSSQVGCKPMAHQTKASETSAWLPGYVLTVSANALVLPTPSLLLVPTQPGRSYSHCRGSGIPALPAHLRIGDSLLCSEAPRV